MHIPFSQHFKKANDFIHSRETNHLSANQLERLDDALEEAYKMLCYNSSHTYGFTEGIAFAFELDGWDIRCLIQEIHDEELRKDDTEYE